MSAGLQRQLASEWEDWRENGKGIRTLKNGVLTESAIDSVDPAILSLFSQGPLALRRGIGHAMAITGLTGCAMPLAHKNLALCGLAETGRGRDQPVFTRLIRNGLCAMPSAGL